MSDEVNAKTGPKCHCLTDGDESRFVSFDISNPTPTQYHTIVVEEGHGKHLPLAESSGNVIHVYKNTGAIGTDWNRIWASSPMINDGDEIQVKYSGGRAPVGVTWQIFRNGVQIASSNDSTESMAKSAE